VICLGGFAFMYSQPLVCVRVCGTCADKEYILMVIQAPIVKPPSDKKKEEKKD
jgi:hypothetical protein